jgi:GGDEF domain-containing protein
VERPEELRLAALFMEHLLAALRGAGYREELARGEVLMVLDLDGLKALNDWEGHLAGDALLRRLGACLQALARSHGGWGFRLGGASSP